MKLIKEYSSSRHAELDALALGNQGILTHVSSKHSYSLGGFVTGVFSVGLWVVFDQQLYDANMFLEDSSHEVSTGFSPKELEDLNEHSEHHSHSFYNRFLVYALSGLGIVAVMVSLLFYTYW
jgi:hypothetical protein